MEHLRMRLAFAASGTPGNAAQFCNKFAEHNCNAYFFHLFIAFSIQLSQKA